MLIAFHCNPTQAHQIEHGQWLKSGFKKHGLDLLVTHNIQQEADIHIISGPHYAKDTWIQHPKVILIDRAYYRQGRSGQWESEDCVSIGWMRRDGGRLFSVGAGRKPPERQDRKSETGTIFLADYDGPMESADTVRLHPARKNYTESLPDALSRHARAVGYSTSALVQAGLQGLEIVCKDKRNIMSESDWLDLLPYADWHHSEIESGELWQHLAQSPHPLTNP